MRNPVTRDWPALLVLIVFLATVSIPTAGRLTALW